MSALWTTVYICISNFTKIESDVLAKIIVPVYIASISQGSDYNTLIAIDWSGNIAVKKASVTKL